MRHRTSKVSVEDSPGKVQSTHCILGDSRRQVGDKGDISVELIVRPKATHNTLADTGGPSWRQVGGKRRTMQLRASTAYWEMLVDKWEASAAKASRATRPRGPEHRQDIWKVQAQRPRSYSHLETVGDERKR